MNDQPQILVTAKIAKCIELTLKLTNISIRKDTHSHTYINLKSGILQQL